MARNENHPDLNLESFNDHRIFTIDELNELFPVVKPYFSALHSNITSLSQRKYIIILFITSAIDSWSMLRASIQN